MDSITRQRDAVDSPAARSKRARRGLVAALLLPGIAVAADVASLGQVLGGRFMPLLVAWLALVLAIALPKTVRPAVLLTARLLLALVAIVALVFAGITPVATVIKPNVEIELIQHEATGDMFGTKLEPTKTPLGYVNQTDSVLRLGVQFEVRNEAGPVLQNATLQLSYPVSLVVESEAKQLSSENREINVFEHHLGDIRKDQVYRTTSRDNVSFPIQYSHKERCYLGRDGVPTCEVYTWDEFTREPIVRCVRTDPGAEFCSRAMWKSAKPPTTTIGFRLMCDGCEPLEGQMEVAPDRAETMYTYDAGHKVLRLDPGDSGWIENEVEESFEGARGRVLEDWAVSAGSRNPIELTYRKVRTPSGEVAQELYVNDRLRKKFIGGDDWVGEQIVDADATPGPDTVKWFSRFWMIEWSGQMLKASYEATPVSDEVLDQWTRETASILGTAAQEGAEISTEVVQVASDQTGL